MNVALLLAVHEVGARKGRLEDVVSRCAWRWSEKGTALKETGWRKMKRSRGISSEGSCVYTTVIRHLRAERNLSSR